MNKTDRKELERAIGLIQEAIEIIENVSESEEEKLNNMPDSLQYSEKGEKIQEGIDELETARADAESASENLQNLIGG